MSVFQNIYTSQYEKSVEYQKQKKYLTDFDFFDTCMTTLINTFKWSSLPDEKLPHFMIEQFLQSAGRVAMYKDDDGNLKIHTAFPCGQITDTGEYDKYTIYTPNGKSFIRGAEDIEICFNNCFKIPYIYKVAQFAEKMSFSLRAVDTALAKACMPSIALFENENQLKKFDKFTNPEVAMQPFVGMIKEKLVSKEVEMLSIYDAKQIDILAYWDVYVRYRNLFYTTIGINNVEVQKRERLTEAEGAGNDEITRYSLLDDMSNCRRDFCDRCKKHFNSEIDFEINRDIATVFQIEADNEEKMRLAKLDFTKGTNPANETETEKAEDIEEPKEPKTTEVKE